MQAYQDLLTRAQGVSQTPYTPYGGEYVAPINQQQQLGIANINAGAGFAQPYMQQALGYANEAAQPITAEQIQQYTSPYTQQVVDATQRQFTNQNAQQDQRLLGNAIAQGALGGNRVGIARAELANQQNLAQAPVIANLMNQGYTQGVATALAEQQAKQAGAYSIGNLGLAGQNAQLTGANAQVGAGTLQQQTQQMQDAAGYQQYLQQMGYPFQTAQWLAGIATGVGSQMGGTSSGQTTSPAPNQTAQWVGAGLTALSMFSDERVKENIKSVGKLNDGQTIYRFNYKGDPTTHVGLIAQEVEKHHPDAVGSVNGIKTVNYEAATDDAVGRWAGGVANFDIGGAVDPNAGLGASPYAGGKSYVPGIGITPGRLPSANFPKLPQQQGTNFKTLNDQAKQLGGLANTIFSRLNSSSGNSMTSGTGDFLGSAGDPTGGGEIVTPAARGGAIDFADGGAPGAIGWVPSIGITPGHPAQANFPKLPNQQGTDFKALNDQIKSGVGGLKDIFNQNSLGDDGLGNINDPNWTGGTPLEGSAPLGMGGIGSAAQGGAVEANFGAPPLNLANGGSPNDILFNPDLMGVAPSQGFTPSNEDPNEASPLPAPVAPPVAPEGIAPVDELSARASPEASPTEVPSGGNNGVALPRGLRNNNPGNIEDGTFARSQPGYAGSDGRFAKFETPAAGASAASNLLGAYGNKGINTLSGIINRWAPAADNNNTGAYISAVSKATGFAPNQPLDMSNPAVRTKVAGAIFGHENGIPGIGGTLEARGYNRSAGLANSAEPTDTTELSAQTKQSERHPAFGISNILNLSPRANEALLAAGLGMMSSRSPFLGVALGEGATQGLQTYQGLRQQEATRALKQSEIDMQAKRLSQQADQFSKELELKKLPYSGAMTSKEKSDVAFRAAQLEEQRRQHNMTLKTPVKIGQTPRGQDLYALPRAGPNGEVEYWPIDPKTGQLGTSPLGGSIKDAAGRAFQEGQPAPTPGGGFRNAAMTEEEALAAAPPQEIRAQQPVASTAARNETYLKYLAEAMGGGVDGLKYANLIKGIADYQINPNALFSLRGNNRQKALEDVLMYDPTYDQRRYAQTNRAISGWAQSPEGRSTRSLSVVIEHLATAEELGEALKSGDIQFLNRVRNALKTQFGYEGPPNFEFAKQIVADEIAKAVIGGVNAEQDRRGLQNQLTAASSPEQLKGVIRVAKELMAGQVVGLKHTYETATGLHNFDKWLTPRAKEAIGTLMDERERKMQAGPRRQQPPAGAPTLSANDQKALEWAAANPNDPRAAAIKKKLGAP